MTKPSRFDISLDPFDLAKKGQVFRGYVQTKDLSRIADQLRQSTELAVELDFGVDALGIRVVLGKVQGELCLECQRCLEPYMHKVDLTFRLAIVASEEMIARLPEGYEPLLVDADEVFLRDIIEDEVILALPNTSTHSEALCSAVSVESSEPEAEVDSEDSRRKPFQGLADLLKRD